MAENLWALREQKKLSVAALANRAGLPISLIMDYESGQRSIDPRHLGRLARALYVEESDIRLHSESRGDQAAPAAEHPPFEPPYPPRPVSSRPASEAPDGPNHPRARRVRRALPRSLMRSRCSSGLDARHLR